MHTTIPLSKLVPARINPRRVKPERDAHRRMVASLRAHGLLESLIVRRIEDSDQYLVIAGARRLAALREIHRGKDPKISCQVRNSGDPEALALAENFVREPMHPLDEAEAFARLIREEDKDVATVMADFGVSESYVRQRMKLSTLSDTVKSAYRQNIIDTGTAEAFAAVPEEKQVEVWQELNGAPRHAEQVRSIIANAWIEAEHAMFDIASLPPEKISRDLFGDRVLVERQAFFDAQQQAVAAEHKGLQEAGWSEVVLANGQSDVQDRLWRMEKAPVAYDDTITKQLDKLQEKYDALETEFKDIDDNDEAALNAHQEKLYALDQLEEALTKDAVVIYSEAVKAIGTVFLILDPDGQFRKEYRVPRPRSQSASSEGDGNVEAGQSSVPTPDDLSDKQKAILCTVKTLTVRRALLESPLIRKRVLALILHEKVVSNAISIQHHDNDTSLHAEKTEGFMSPARELLRAKRADVDPLLDDFDYLDIGAYVRLSSIPESQLDSLIDLLTVECLMANASFPTPLVERLAAELGIDLRKEWCPDAMWLGSYQKLQLEQLISQLCGPVYGASFDQKKKSELLSQVVALFADAASGKLDDKESLDRINQWLPAEFAPPAKQDRFTTGCRKVKKCVKKNK